MKVSNEFVEVKIGNRSFTKKNMILNTYLNKIFNSQMDTEHSRTDIHRCFIKLDTPIENLNYNSELSGTTDFDIIVYPSFVNQIILDKNFIKVIYNFDITRYLYDGKVYYNSDFYMFDGRKITAIGFGINDECVAVADTSNMNIIINTKENFHITRVDNFQSDGTCSNFDYPLHLVNDVAKAEEKYFQLPTNDFVYEYTMAQLYSVGFGNVEGLMEEEYLIENVEVDRDDYSITLNVPRTKKVGFYPSENLHLGFYPVKDNSKYLIFKYRLYRRYIDLNDEYVVTYLDRYYTMSKPNTDFGDLNIKLKIERG